VRELIPEHVHEAALHRWYHEHRALLAAEAAEARVGWLRRIIRWFW